MNSQGLKFGVVAFVLQAIFILGMGLFGEYRDRPAAGADYDFARNYPNFQDVNVMVFVGFGFLMTFLKSYSFGAVGFNLLISALSVQWSAIVIGFIHADILGGDKFQYGVTSMVESCFATATVLISFGAVLGKTSPVQLLVMAIFEILFAQISKYVCVEHFHAVDVGESMYLHMFGAYFGLAVARVLYNPDAEDNEKEGSVYHSDLFAMIGSLFLFMYWPTFNGGFAGVQSENAVVNTYLSLCACTVITFAMSAILDGKGKFDMVHIQNSTLAGGVAVGACANMPMKPFVAMVIGAAAGMVSVIGYKYITPLLSSKAKLHDTCGVHNLHGLPAWIAAIAAAILAASASVSDWKEDVGIFPKMHYDIATGTKTGRSFETQGGYQMLAAVLTFGVAIVTGALTGLLLKLPIWNAPKEGSLFDDRENWQAPSEGLPFKLAESKPEDTRM